MVTQKLHFVMYLTRDFQGSLAFWQHRISMQTLVPSGDRRGISRRPLKRNGWQNVPFGLKNPRPTEMK